MDSQELQRQLEEAQAQIKTLSEKVERQDSDLKNWNDFQLRDPIDTYTRRIIETYGSSVTADSTTTFTNKRITKRVGSTASSSSLTIDSDSYDLYRVTALAAGMTINAPSGTPTDGQPLLITIKDNGTARALTWNAIFRVIGVTLPTTTVISKYNVIGCIYHSGDAKWDVVMSLQQA